MIKSLHNEYFQKSKIFIYPALGISRGGSVTPIRTYLSWDGKYSANDCKLLVLYHLRDDPEFIKFEKTSLLKNKFFEDFYELEENKGLYVFDFSDYKKDWEYFLEGRYSKLSVLFKTAILLYYQKSKKNYVYVDSYINPEMYFEIYSKLLGCDVDVLREVGELCDKPDLDKEHLTLKEKELNIELNKNQ